MVFSFFMLILIVRLTIKKGRLYCNTVCPVGTFLGFASRISVFRIRLDEALCNSCGTCGAKCKSSCIDTKNKQVDFSRCVGCFNCLTVCPGNGVKFSLPFKKQNCKQLPNLNTESDRRHFLLNSASLSIGCIGYCKRFIESGY